MFTLRKTCTAAVLTASLATATTISAGIAVRVPMVCSQGPSNQYLVATLTLPGSVAQGGTYVVRIDGVPSGEISHLGLDYIHDMATDYVTPPGATYVAGSAHVVPGTGTANVAAGARVWQEPGLIRTLLPGHVGNGSSYTPPSIEFRLVASAAPGSSLALAFSEYRLTAHAFLVGDVHTTCQPNPKPSTLGTTLVTAP